MVAIAIAARKAAAPHKEDRMKRATWWTLLLLTMAAPALAQDGSGFARSGANLRAGPANAYPRVATVVGGDSITVYGCVDDFSWCDVRWREARGWLPAGVVEFDARDGAFAPVIGFAIDPYWDAHYRGRPWARDRARWRQQAQTAPSAPAPMPEALKRQLIPQRIADTRGYQPAPPAAEAPLQPQWVPPGERMYQAPPPDALNPKRNKELAEQQRRDEEDRRWRESMHQAPEPSHAPSSASSWWPPKPETVAQAAQHTPPPPPPKPASPPPPPPPSAPPPQKERTQRDDEKKRRDDRQLER